MSKPNPADLEADRLFRLQLSLAEQRKSSSVLLTLLSFIFILCFGLLIFFLPHKQFSENENRYLQGVPEFSLASLADGDYTEKLSAFCSDNFPFRSFFVALHSYSELSSLRLEAGGVIPAKGNILVAKPVLTNDVLVNYETNLSSIAELSNRFSSDGLDCTFAIAPQAANIYADRLTLYRPFSLPLPDSAIDLLPVLSGKDKVWFRTDHHWTSYGAFLAYQALADYLEYTPLTDFTTVVVSSAFHGTAWSKSGLYLTPAEDITLFRFDGDEDYTVSGDFQLSGFYDTDKLSDKDKYAVFLGGNYGHITVSNSSDKPKLLIIKDSYANSLVPFLARHFTLEIVDPRYFHGSIDELAANCDRVLFLFGISSLCSGNDIIKLTFR